MWFALKKDQINLEKFQNMLKGAKQRKLCNDEITDWTFTKNINFDLYE